MEAELKPRNTYEWQFGFVIKKKQLLQNLNMADFQITEFFLKTLKST